MALFRYLVSLSRTSQMSKTIFTVLRPRLQAFSLEVKAMTGGGAFNRTVYASHRRVQLSYRSSRHISCSESCRHESSDQRLGNSNKQPTRYVKTNTTEDSPVTSVLVDMLMPDDKDSATTRSEAEMPSVNTADIDSRIKELEELASVQIRAVDMAIELEVDSEIDSESPDGPITEVAISGQPSRKVRLFGSPDPSVPASNVPCHGCGAHLHCRDPGVAGYLPSQVYLATRPSKLKDALCQRCHLLKEFNIAIDASVKPLEFEAISAVIRQTSPALLLVILDLTDLPNSFYEGFAGLASEHRPVCIVGNKVDLLPQDAPGYLQRIRDHLEALCAEKGIEPKHITLVSAKTGYGIEELITELLRNWKSQGQVYILGCTNAGKSTLFNSLLASDFCRIAARDVIQRATASIWPGTTMNLLKFPIMNPKPIVLHRRMLRLHQQRAAQTEEEKLRRVQLKATGRSQYATLMGHIGVTSATPREIAVDHYFDEHPSSGFVVPSYEFDINAVRNAESTSPLGQLRDNLGTESVLKRLKIRVEKYDDKTFKYWCYDTPGLVNPEQIINMLTSEELMVLLVNELITPRSFYVKPTFAMYVSGLGRIDYLQGDKPVVLTVFAAAGIPVHVLSRDEADDFYRKNIGTTELGIPLGDSERLSSLPPLAGREFSVEGTGLTECCSDIILSSIGWVSVSAEEGQQIVLRGSTPGGLGCLQRSPALLPDAINLRGKRIRGTYAYHVRPPKPSDY